MKLLHVASHWGVIRGGAIQLFRMAVEQHLRGHDVTVVFPDQFFRNPLLRKRDLDSWKTLAHTGVNVKKLGFRSVNGVRRLGSFLNKNHFDLIHVHRNEALIKTTMALDLKKISTPVVVQRGTITVPTKEHLLLAFKSPNVKAYTVVANAVKDVLTAALGKDRKKMIHVVYGSVDTDRFSYRIPDKKIMAQLKTRMNFPGNVKIIGSLSSYRKSKRLDLLLSALSKIMEQNERVRGVFLGDKMHKEIIPLAKQLGIYNKCCFTGFQFDIRPWLSIMDLSVVSANNEEGLSGVIRESLSMDIPAVSTACAGNTEIIVDKKTGLLIPVDDEKALESSISWAIDHPNEMKEMAKKGREWVISHCSVKTQVDRLDKIYSDICTNL